MSLLGYLSNVISRIVILPLGGEVLRTSQNTESTDIRIARTLSVAHDRYDECKATISAALRDMPRSRRLFDQASIIVQLAQLAECPPHTNFMSDIATSLLKLMEDLLAYVRNEASHPIFQWIWNMNRESSALDGKIYALKTLLEAELEWKRNHDGPQRMKLERDTEFGNCPITFTSVC